ncbi:MAG: hypothetical protein B7Z29_16755 [Hyphomicrobium sp. 12-62-95]|nr:MAG: hypothetical protein B7Z29_16755 [Hyphomicrobium sp. 12-62-95]
MVGKLDNRIERTLAVAAFIQFFFCVILAVAIPKATTVSLGILVAGSLFVRLLHVPGRTMDFTVPIARWLALMVLPAWIAVSSFWSDDPEAAYTAAICLAFPMIAYGVVASSSNVLPTQVVRACHNGFMAGVALAVVAAAIDVMSEQGLSRWVFSTWPNLPEAQTRHVAFENGTAVFVSEATPNRRAIVLVCLLPAFIHGISKLRTRAQMSLIAIPGLLGYGALLMSTRSLTAQMAVGAGALVFLAAIYTPRINLLGLSSAWIAIWILVVPSVLLMAEARFDQAPWLPPSAAERVEIWSGVAQDVRDRPYFGHGVGAEAYTSVLDKTHEADTTRVSAHHPHNGFLQIWHELGGFGVVLFSVFGLWLMGRIRLLPQDVTAHFYGLFAICGAISATGFGLWQHWHLSAFGLAAGLLRVVSNREQPKIHQPTVSMETL